MSYSSSRHKAHTSNILFIFVAVGILEASMDYIAVFRLETKELLQSTSIFQTLF